MSLHIFLLARDLILSQFSIDCCQNAFASGALPRTRLGGLQRPPNPQLENLGRRHWSFGQLTQKMNPPLLATGLSRHPARLSNVNYDPAKVWSDRVESGPPLIRTACPQPRPVLPPGADLPRNLLFGQPALSLDLCYHQGQISPASSGWN